MYCAEAGGFEPPRAGALSVSSRAQSSTLPRFHCWLPARIRTWTVESKARRAANYPTGDGLESGFMEGGSESKPCSRCRATKPVTEFSPRWGRPGQYQSWCKECHRDYNAADYQANREARLAKSVRQREEVMVWYRGLKESLPCADCGRFWPHSVTQFDHLGTAEKAGNVADLVVSASRARVLAEIAKCELVCGNCHAIRTHKRRVA
jgi:hypothetical protein